ncbi:T-cell-specific guanine nucleotide triphosphate-binding protein 1-like [Lingula anatina]|uniref:T-cell-specific guanine nucleotide triphosphate-binding protein 1-like n=1 Tax=Lingula anatina TaxID=7574 RepID=A0A1S3HHQ3_LINAN|nr:T-cell-specific guanine nucleotide triphosphate-binding protein 1-like [Lingula anatina]|eukprot:XP_013385552.1 T-cell-specific guanine nucleotide triphosphate-binding protein 1-like [Lingula anatina]
MQEESKYQFIEPEELEEFEAYYKQHGRESIADFMVNKIKEVENVSVKIAVTGMAGSGKSTFINTFRGLTADDDGAAPAGDIDTNEVPREYHHPQIKNITLSDLPGIGTHKFNRGNYEEKVNFGSYDFFLIFTNIRIFEDVLWLAKKAQLRRKKYFIVRTRIDADIESERQCQPLTHDASRLLEIIREQTKKLLEEQRVYPEDGVYLISTLLSYVDQWDYRKLERDILHRLPRVKREILTFSLNNLSEDLIKEKCQTPRSRLWKMLSFWK